jgi:hypothetical protein
LTDTDMEGETDLRAPHVVEAIGYRSLGRDIPPAL